MLLSSPSPVIPGRIAPGIPMRHIPKKLAAVSCIPYIRLEIHPRKKNVPLKQENEFVLPCQEKEVFHLIGLQ